jgi:transposase
VAVAAGWLCTSPLLTTGGLRTEGAGVQFGHAGKSSWSCSDRLNPVIDELSKAIEQEAERRPEVQLLMTHPGVGPITALAFALIIGTPERFDCGRQITSCLRTDSLRGVQRRSLAAGAHQQARECADALLAGGGTGNSTM